MKQLLKFKRYVTLACIMIISIFATRKALSVNIDDVKKSEHDIASIMKQANHWHS